MKNKMKSINRNRIAYPNVYP